MSEPGLLSVVVPAYNEEQVLPAFHERVSAVLRGLGGGYELIFVNDGSTDGTAGVLRALCAKDPRARALHFSRNFGHQLAITAGLDRARGDAVVVIDSDLQDPPELIPELVAKWREGHDVVYAVRAKRESESPFKLLTARLFYRLLRTMTSVDIPADAGDFRLMSRRAVESLNRMRERHRFVRGMASWIGFRTARVAYERRARHAGKTKYPFHKMLHFAIDAIVSFSDKPLRMATYLGFSVSLLSVFMIAYFVFYKFFPEYIGYPPLPPGTTAVIVSLFFLGGVQLICIGIVGEYLGRLYEEAKDRPLYIVAEEDGAPAER